MSASPGVGDTVTGPSQFLRCKNPKPKGIATQPTESHDLPGSQTLSWER
jgi:hypothetical protein